MIPAVGPDLAAAGIPLEAPPVRATSLLRRSIRLWRTRIGVLLVGLLVMLAIVGPFVAPYGPTTPVGAPNSLPGGKAVLGTDYLGQDVLSRVLYGGRSILIMALIATAAGLIVGVVIGLVAAYARNALDDVLMRAMDVIMAFPQIMLGLVAVAVVGAQAWVIVTAIALTTVPRIARIARGAALPVVERDFIASAEAMGVPRRRILFVDLLPNVMAQVIVYATLLIPLAIVSEASLSFLGVGVPPPTADWGAMISDASGYFQYGYWWFLFFPSVALLTTTLAFNIFGDSVRDALDPRGAGIYV